MSGPGADVSILAEELAAIVQEEVACAIAPISERLAVVEALAWRDASASLEDTVKGALHV